MLNFSRFCVDNSKGWNSASRDACLFQDVVCIPFLYMSKSLSRYVTEVNNGAFCCCILVKWTRFLGVREGMQKRLSRGDISSCELGSWVLAVSLFLRRNWIRCDQILTAWAFPLQLFYNAGIFVALPLEMEPMFRPDTSVTNPQTTPLSIPEEPRPLLWKGVLHCMPSASALSKSFQSSVGIFLHSTAAMFLPFFTYLETRKRKMCILCNLLTV